MQQEELHVCELQIAMLAAACQTRSDVVEAQPTLCRVKHGAAMSCPWLQPGRGSNAMVSANVLSQYM